MGYKCNLQCTHCHVDASPGRTEEMPRAAIKASLDILKSNRLITTVILTGGAPELNIHFLEAVELFTDAGAAVIVCSNLVIYTEAGMQDIPEILAKRNVKIITSLPGLTRHDNDKQRGRGTYERNMPQIFSKKRYFITLCNAFCIMCAKFGILSTQ